MFSHLKEHPQWLIPFLIVSSHQAKSFVFSNLLHHILYAFCCSKIEGQWSQYRIFPPPTKAPPSPRGYSTSCLYTVSPWSSKKMPAHSFEFNSSVTYPPQFLTATKVWLTQTSARPPRFKRSVSPSFLQLRGSMTPKTGLQASLGELILRCYKLFLYVHIWWTLLLKLCLRLTVRPALEDALQNAHWAVYMSYSGEFACLFQGTARPYHPQKGFIPLDTSPSFLHGRPGAHPTEGPSPSHRLPDMMVPRSKEVRCPIHFYQGVASGPKCVHQTQQDGFRAIDWGGIRLRHLLAEQPPARSLLPCLQNGMTKSPLYRIVVKGSWNYVCKMLSQRQLLTEDETILLARKWEYCQATKGTAEGASKGSAWHPAGSQLCFRSFHQDGPGKKCICLP